MSTPCCGGALAKLGHHDAKGAQRCGGLPLPHGEAVRFGQMFSKVITFHNHYREKHEEPGGLDNISKPILIGKAQSELGGEAM